MIGELVYRKPIYIGRFLIALLGAVGTLVLTDARPGTFILVWLVLLLNIQVRIVFLKYNWSLLSIFADVAVSFWLLSNFGGLVYLLLLIPVFDGFLMFEAEAYMIGLLSLITAFLATTAGDEVLVLFSLLVIGTAAFARAFGRINKKLIETELLYDKIRHYSYELEGAKTRLESYSLQVQRLSQVEERSRISREIHDTIGHKLTGVLMQLEAAIRLASIDQAEAISMLAAVRDNLSQSIDVLRETVRKLKPQSTALGLAAIKNMITDFSHNTGSNVNLSVTGQTYKLYPSIELTLFRNAQEALTNAIRHGQAKHIEVEVNFREDRVELVVSDDGVGCLQVEKGMGLSGMEERAAVHSGNVQFSSTQQGFIVKTTIPIRGGEVIGY